MNHLLIILIVLLTPAGPPVSGQSWTDPCEVYGVIYVAKKQHEADHIVYIEKEPGVAQVAVYKEKMKLMADRSGLWHFTDSRNFADHVVYFTEDSRMADFTIEYVEELAFAGCQ